MAKVEREYDGEVVTDRKASVRKPRPYNVVLINDNYTTMDFVVQVLEVVFHHPPSAAVQIMLQVHQQGRGIAGTYPKDIAETRRREAELWAKASEFPLKLVVEPA